jgi:hypothetical protein
MTKAWHDPQLDAFQANLTKFEVSPRCSYNQFGDAVGNVCALLEIPSPAFVQRNPKFAEGSMPEVFSPLGEETNALLHFWFGLDPRTRFKVGMDGMGMLATGLIWLDTSNDYAHMLAVKGDIYNKGKVGVLGGMASDRDKGDPMKTMLRECGEEVGNFPYDRNRLFPIHTTDEWRETDSRGSYAICSTFYVYLATGEETQALVEGYARHVQATGGDPEIQSIRPFTRREVLEHIRDSRMGYFDQTQAFTMAALCLQALQHDWNPATFGPLSDEQRWLMARGLMMPGFRKLTDLTNGDWRPRINPDDFGV